MVFRTLNQRAARPRLNPNRTRSARHLPAPAKINRQATLTVESLEMRQLMAGDASAALGILPPIEPYGTVLGTKWNDLNANSSREADEPGLPGVTIYADLNGNTVFDADEPSTVTLKDDPNTRFDEGGRYTLEKIPAGDLVVIREVVPEGWRQTFPRMDTPGPFPLPPIDPLAIPPIWIGFGGHVVHMEPGSTHERLDFGNTEWSRKPGSVTGTKWLDENENGWRDRGEPGLAGVTIYADTNWNGQLDTNEPATKSRADDPATDFDESGRYELLELPIGQYVIREVIPEGYRQTFPQERPIDIGPPIGIDPILFLPAPGDNANPADEFSTVRPQAIALASRPGESVIQEVAIAVHPFCILPYHIDVISSDPSVDVKNLSGIQINGCGGDVSSFKVQITNPQSVLTFDLLFVQAESQAVIGKIPVTFGQQPPSGEGHWVAIFPGSAYEGLDFGNAKAGTGSLQGRKWLDRDADGTQDADEPGLGGISIYLDRNNNSQYDVGERITITATDNPQTDFDEGGLYSFDRLRPGDYVVREIVSYPYQQTFPGISAQVVSSETREMKDGSAIDLDVTHASLIPSDDTSALFSAKVGLTVVWPDSCGTLNTGATSSTRIGNTIIVDLQAGEPLGELCKEVLTPQVETVVVDGLQPGNYTVVGVLNESVRKDGPLEGTLAVLGEIAIGGAGAHFVTLAEGQSIDGLNFGNVSTIKPGAIHGMKWHDANGNARWDEGEEPLAGVTIYLDTNWSGAYEEGEPSTQSMKDNPLTLVDETGHYWFRGVDPGTYVVREVVPEGYRQTYPARQRWDDILPPGFKLDPLTGEAIGPDGAILPWPFPRPFIGQGHLVTVESGGTVEKVLFGNQRVREPALVHGFKWFDENGNGQRDQGEPGLGGVVIFSDYNLNGQLDEDEPSTVTIPDDPTTRQDEGGEYWLSVMPGEQVILEQVPPGYLQTYPNIFRKVRFPYNLGHGIDAQVGGIYEGLDFGNRKDNSLGGISGVKWHDVNGNGQRDGNEPGIGDVVIYADLDNNGQFDANEPAARTSWDLPDTDFDEGGMYVLADLPAGTYTIREVTPKGMEQTFPGRSGYTFGSSSQDLPGGQALSFDLTNVYSDPLIDSLFSTVLEFHVVWPNGCGGVGAIDVNYSDTSVHVNLYGGQTGDICTMALRNETQRVHIRDLSLEGYTVTATLWESVSPMLPAFQPSFELKARIHPNSSDGAHYVTIVPGQSVSDVNFGNRRIGDPGRLLGDIDQDGKLGVGDIDKLAIALRTGNALPDAHDLSGDGLANRSDADFLVHTLMRTREGDANLDGLFDTSDLVRVFQAGKFEDGQKGNASWSEGDWDGDGDFTTGDLVVAFQRGRYEGGPRASEPLAADAVDAAWAALSLSGKRRK